MKTKFIVSAFALAAVAVASHANAVQLNSAGVGFTAYNASDATVIDYLPYGVRNLATTPRPVIGPIGHLPSDGVTISIDGLHTGVQTTACTIYSYNFDGTQLAAVTKSTGSVSGHWELSAALTTMQSRQWAYFSVLCTIPANALGVIIGATTLA